jgi:hypothetical protein
MVPITEDTLRLSKGISHLQSNPFMEMPQSVFKREQIYNMLWCHF